MMFSLASNSTCKLIDILYVEIRNEDITGQDGEVQGCLVTQTWWLTDEYGNRQSMFDMGQSIAEGLDLEIGRTGDGFPYYQCNACREYLQSWDEAKVHVGDDEDLDDPVLRARWGRR